MTTKKPPTRRAARSRSIGPKKTVDATAADKVARDEFGPEAFEETVAERTKRAAEEKKKNPAAPKGLSDIAKISTPTRPGFASLPSELHEIARRGLQTPTPHSCSSSSSGSSSSSPHFPMPSSSSSSSSPSSSSYMTTSPFGTPKDSPSATLEEKEKDSQASSIQRAANALKYGPLYEAPERLLAASGLSAAPPSATGGERATTSGTPARGSNVSRQPPQGDENQDDVKAPIDDVDGGAGGPQAAIARGGNVATPADVVARVAARSMAGIQPAKPTQEVAAGYIGGRNLENSDILNSGATGTARQPGGRPGDPPVAVAPGARGPDEIIDAKASHSNVTDTLRPSFGIAPPQAIVPSERAQVESEVLASDFSYVAPGFGLGVTNKMRLMEETRDKKIVYREPLCEPRKYDGPTMCVETLPLEFQNEITRRDRQRIIEREIALMSAAAVLETQAKKGSLNILGDDYGALQRVSDRGLKRPLESPFEPLMRTPKAWERVEVLPGVQLQRRDMREVHNALRYPERFSSDMAMQGGATSSRRNALAALPFPITTN